MASRETDYLNMHDWVGTDPWRRAEVSENFKKLDTKAKDLDQSMAATVEVAANAKQVADGIDSKASEALTNSENAIKSGNAALQTATSADQKAREAKTTSEDALSKATAAEETAVSVQTQFDQVVISGDSSVEAAQARVDTDGQAYANLKQRLDSEHQELTGKLADKAKQEDLEIERARISLLTAHAGNTDDNAELLDIRVGFDGVTYATAGEATRAIGGYMTEENQPWEVL